MDLGEFLLARIAEDEAVARDAVAAHPKGDVFREHPFGAGPRWVAEGGMISTNPQSDAEPGWDLWDNEGAGSLCMADEHATHLARWDPSRVLAECEAKRRIVELNRAEWAGAYGAPNYCSSTIDEIFCLLALPYADHPDYRPEWSAVADA